MVCFGNCNSRNILLGGRPVDVGWRHRFAHDSPTHRSSTLGHKSRPRYNLGMKNILVTGGAGFIGANFVIYMLEKHPDLNVVVYDKLTYAGNLDNLLDVSDNPNYAFVKGDICDADAVDAAIEQHKIDTIVNFAAETHVDRSILDPDAFLDTNIRGTYTLLEAARKHGLDRYHQISTDEVYGDVEDGYSSVESDNLVPRSPYAASKASADLMVNAYYVTYGLPITISRGGNNIGPYQYPEKVIPLFTTNAMDGLPLPVYGDGLQKREYQFVIDHVKGIEAVLMNGEIGETYNIGVSGDEELTNMRMVELLLDELGASRDLIRHVEDRPGHDRRYSMDVSKLRGLGWEPDHTNEEAIRKTVRWYADNEWWWRKVKDKGDYKDYYERQYGKRLAEAAG